jgi:hypothetical protein
MHYGSWHIQAIQTCIAIDCHTGQDCLAHPMSRQIVRTSQKIAVEK